MKTTTHDGQRIDSLGREEVEKMIVEENHEETSEDLVESIAYRN